LFKYWELQLETNGLKDTKWHQQFVHFAIIRLQLSLKKEKGTVRFDTKCFALSHWTTWIDAVILFKKKTVC